MKINKLPLLLILTLALSIGVIAYAATGDFTMTYLTGTTDTVTNMPANDNGTGGQTYTVSSTIPEREGYEFLGWTLDYEVKLPIHYSVQYILRKTNGTEMLLGTKTDIETYEDDFVTENPENFKADGYVCDNPDEVITKTVTDGEVIKFYYYELPIHYSVKYILRDENQQFVKELGSKNDAEAYRNDPVTEKPANFEADGYVCDNPDEVITKTVTDGEVIYFYYHELPIHYSVKYILRDKNQHFVKELGSKDDIEVYKDVPVTEKPENFEADGYVCDDPDEVITKTVTDGEVIKFYYYEPPIHYSIVYYYDADTSIEGDEVEIYREDNLEAMKDEAVRVRSPQTYSDGTTVYVLNRPNNQTARVYDGYEFKIYYTLKDIIF